VLVGEKDKAVKVLAEHFKSIKSPKDCSAYFKVIETEQQLRLTDEALAHCAQVLAQAEREEQEAKLLGQVFTDRGPQAAVWWRFLRRKHPKEERLSSLKKLQAIMDGNMRSGEFSAVVKEAAKEAGALPQAENPRLWFQALGETCLTYGQTGQ